MSYFDELYAGFLGRYSPLWGEIHEKREVIDVEYVDMSNETASPDNSSLEQLKRLERHNSQPQDVNSNH